MKKAAGKMRSLILDKRAVSVALSTLIITAGVVGFGITVLYWAYSWGGIANHEYSEAVTSSQSAILEKIAFEYAHYHDVTLPNGTVVGNLTVYIINCGKTDNVSIARVFIRDSQLVLLPDRTYSNVQLKDATSNMNTTGVNIGGQAYFNIEMPPLAANSYYTISLITQRGRQIDYSFAT